MPEAVIETFTVTAPGGLFPIAMIHKISLSTLVFSSYITKLWSPGFRFYQELTTQLYRNLFSLLTKLDTVKKLLRSNTSNTAVICNLGCGHGCLPAIALHWCPCTTALVTNAIPLCSDWIDHWVTIPPTMLPWEPSLMGAVKPMFPTRVPMSSGYHSLAGQVHSSEFGFALNECDDSY